MQWFNQWEAFVTSKSWGKANDPPVPGPISNSGICNVKALMNGQIVLKVGADYASISEEMWTFLHSIYGGGPVVSHHSQRKMSSSHIQPQKQAEQQHQHTQATQHSQPMQQEEQLVQQQLPNSNINSNINCDSQESPSSTHCNSPQPMELIIENGIEDASVLSEIGSEHEDNDEKTPLLPIEEKEKENERENERKREREEKVNEKSEISVRKRQHYVHLNGHEQPQKKSSHNGMNNNIVSMEHTSE